MWACVIAAAVGSIAEPGRKSPPSKTIDDTLDGRRTQPPASTPAPPPWPDFFNPLYSSPPTPSYEPPAPSPAPAPSYESGGGGNFGGGGASGEF
jgi:hypothetical protein